MNEGLIETVRLLSAHGLYEAHVVTQRQTVYLDIIFYDGTKRSFRISPETTQHSLIEEVK